MKFLIVDSTRKTSIGTFRPGILYTVDENQPRNKTVLNALVYGKDEHGRKKFEPVGSYLTEAEAEAFRKERSQEAAKEKGADQTVPAEQKSTLLTADVTGLKAEIASKTKAIEKLQKDLQVEKDSSFDLEAKLTNAEAALRGQEEALATAEQKCVDLEAEVTSLKSALEQAQAQPDDGKTSAEDAETKSAKGDSK